MHTEKLFKEFVHLEKLSLNFFKVVVCNPFQSSPSLIHISLWFSVVSLLFFFLNKLIFSSLPQLKDKFACVQNNSKYLD